MDSVLIIDKNFVNLSYITDSLEEDGIKIRKTFIEDFVKDIKETESIINKEHYECIIIRLSELTEDIELILKVLKNNRNTRMTPIVAIILLSRSITLSEVINKLMNISVHDYIAEVPPAVALKKIKNAIEYKKRLYRTNIFEQQYLSIFNSAKTISFILTKNFKIKLFNRPAMKVFGINTRYLGVSFLDLLKNENTKKALSQILEQKKYKNHKEFLFKTITVDKSTNKSIKIKWRIICIYADVKHLAGFLLIGENEKQNLTQTKNNNEDINNMRKELLNTKKQLIQTKKKLKQQNNLEDQLTETKKQLDELSKQKEKLKNNDETKKEEIKSLKTALDDTYSQINDMKKIKEKLEEDTNSNQEEIESLKSSLEEAYKEIERMKNIKTNLKEDENRINLNELSKTINNTQMQIEEMKQLKIKLEKGGGANEKEIDILKKEFETIFKQIETMERLKRRLEEHNIDNKDVVDKLKTEINKAQQHNQNLIKVLKQYTSKSTWKYLIHRIIMHKNHTEETFVVEDYGTMVFGDVQGFTKFAERFSPEEVLLSLNQMFTMVTEVVYFYDGDIDKFIGDAFFAVFKDPLKAVKAVYKIAKKVDELNDDRMMNGLTPLFFRFGINSGKAVRGDIGGNLRRENTLIGDTVNIAQRLESRSIPGQILISESTYNFVKDHIVVSDKVELKVKGRKNPVTAYYIESVELEEEQETESP